MSPNAVKTLRIYNDLLFQRKCLDLQIQRETSPELIELRNQITNKIITCLANNREAFRALVNQKRKH